MSLSCGCDDFLDYDNWYEYPEDFTVYAGKRRVRCKSCSAMISPGEQHVAVPCFRSPLTDIEYKIMGEEVPLAPIRLCERCGEIMLALVNYGYCVDLNDSMPSQLREHWELVGYSPPNAAHGLAAEAAA